MDNKTKDAMQMALEDLRAVWPDSRASITALREALRNASERMAQPQGKECKYNSGICNRRGCRGICQATELGKKYRELEVQPQDHSEQHLNMVQGEWVDLTEDEIEQLYVSNPYGAYYYIGFVREAIAKFKEKNTPKIVPQGEPVAWGEVVLREGEVTVSGYLYGQLPVGTKLYTTPPSVEAAIEATKEKAAKVCEKWAIGDDDRLLKIAAAIRSMK